MYRSIAVTAWLTLALPALALDHYFTQGATLYRWNGTTLTNLGTVTGLAGGTNALLPALAFHPATGALWTHNSGDYCYYSINLDTLQAAKLFSSGGAVISFDFRNVAGVWQVFGMDGDTLRIRNATTGAAIANVVQNLGSEFPATAYDAMSDTYWGARNNKNTLHVLNFSGPGGTGRVIKNGANTLTWSLAGAAWFDGQMYMGIRDNDTDTVRLGILDTGTAVWTQLAGATLSLPVDVNAMGYAVTTLGHCPGDTDCDGVVTFADIDPFVARLGCPSNDPLACNTPIACPWSNADVNGDGSVTFADIDPFVGMLGTTCP